MHLKMYKMHVAELLGGRRSHVPHSGVGRGEEGLPGCATVPKNILESRKG